MKLRYTILFVDDVARSLAFFEKAFGLSRGFLHESGDYGELDTGETKLAFSSRALMESLKKNPRKPDPKAPSFEVAFETLNVSDAFAKALEAGATPIQQPEDMPWGQTTAYVADPDGYLVELCTPVMVPSA